LDLPFAVKVGSQDWHPKDHISFDSQHDPANYKAFESWVEVSNPANPKEKEKLQLWPVHCVQDTDGANIIPEINSSKLELIVKKGLDRRTEMFSAISDMFGNKEGVATVDLASYLKGKGVTHVYAVGLTGDCCVRYTALDAVKEGFRVFVIEDGVKSVDQGQKGWGEARDELEAAGVKIIHSTDARLKKLDG
jgi:nicotinamidase-related amidase